MRYGAGWDNGRPSCIGFCSDEGVIRLVPYRMYSDLSWVRILYSYPWLIFYAPHEETRKKHCIFIHLCMLVLQVLVSFNLILGGLRTVTSKHILFFIVRALFCLFCSVQNSWFCCVCWKQKVGLECVTFTPDPAVAAAVGHLPCF